MPAPVAVRAGGGGAAGSPAGGAAPASCCAAEEEAGARGSGPLERGEAEDGSEGHPAALAMSQAGRRERGALEVKFVPDEQVLKHIAEDSGTAGPGRRPRSGPGSLAPPGREPSPGG